MDDSQPNAERGSDSANRRWLRAQQLARAASVPHPHNDARASGTARSDWPAIHGPLLIGAGLVGFQFLLAYLLREQSWWVIVLAAWFVGAFAAHALFVVIHEATHRLILNGTAANRLAGIFANLPLILPSSMSFELCHLKHHAYQGVYEYDVDLPNHWELKFFGSSVLGQGCLVADFTRIAGFAAAQAAGRSAVLTGGLYSTG